MSCLTRLPTDSSLTQIIHNNPQAKDLYDLSTSTARNILLCGLVTPAILDLKQTNMPLVAASMNLAVGGATIICSPTSWKVKAQAAVCLAIPTIPMLFFGCYSQ
jgi:hypothetical protein